MIKLKPFKQKGTIKKAEKIKIGTLIGHGDVTLVRISELPAELSTYKKDEENLLALGEFSGHAHKVFPEEGAKVELYKAGDGLPMYLKIEGGGATIKHQEHFPIQIPGDSLYKVYIKKQYDPFAKRIREVQD